MSGSSGHVPALEGERTPPPRFGEAVQVWARIGLLGFGGPAGQIALMHRLLIEERGWVRETDFLHALNFCMLLPGPEAQQLAIYVGWLLHGRKGGLTAGTLFVLPGLIVMLALSWAYVLLGRTPAVAGALQGLKAAVLAIVALAMVRIGRRALGGSARRLLAAAAFAALFLFDAPFPAVVAAAATIGYAAGRLDLGGFAPPGAGGARAPDTAAGDDCARSPTLATAAGLLLLCLIPVALLAGLLGPDDPFAKLARFFATMAVVTFGGAYAVLAYVGQAAVETHGWLTPAEMLDGLALAETTPGPLILVLQFVGFLAAYREPDGLEPLLAGTLGALLTAWVTFVPSFVWIFLGAPWMERLRTSRALAAALAAITAAVVGVIASLALWFAIHVLFRRVAERSLGPLSIDLPDPASLDATAALLCAAAFVLLFGFRLGILPLLGLAALAGLSVRQFTG